MPYLGPENSPPSSQSIGISTLTRKDQGLEGKVAPSSVSSQEFTRRASLGLNEGGALNNEVTSVYPVVKLDAEEITDAIAGRLATSLLGHVLFLKNQIPLPVSQLGRISSMKTSSRAFKQRTELLSEYDTISSHLETTFSALSTSLARSSSHTQRQVAQAYLAFLVGPSISTAKTKVILGIDGLETRIWGTRDDAPTRDPQKQDRRGDREGGDSSELEDEEEEYDAEGSEQGSDDGDMEEYPDDSEDEGDAEDEDDGFEDEGPCYHIHSSPPPPSVSHAEKEKFLQNADRLLSRTLATADMDGNGIISEIGPTQTHILIRAPRRFIHPAWIPRQNITAALDTVLHGFLTKSGQYTTESNVEMPGKRLKEQKLEGVWITTRSGLRRLPSAVFSLDSSPEDNDDMIWWSWDGKFVGFSEW